MRREDFSTQLDAATFAALRFAQTMVAQALSINVQYRLHLNQSCDDDLSDDEVAFPKDNGRTLLVRTRQEVVEALFRNGRCPVWIDISVQAASGIVSELRLLCAGRYHDDECKLYYYDRGTQPFGIKSPDLPTGWREGTLMELPAPSEVAGIHDD